RSSLPKWPPISAHAMSKASQMVSRASGPNAAPSCITGVGTVGEALIRGRDDQHDLPCLRIGHAGGHDASLPFKPAPIIYGVSRHRVQRVALDDDTSMEVAVLKGKTTEVKPFAERIIAERGVRHGRVVIIPAEIKNVRHSHGK